MDVLAQALAPLGKQALLYLFEEAQDYVSALLHGRTLSPKQLEDFYLHLDVAARLDDA